LRFSSYADKLKIFSAHSKIDFSFQDFSAKPVFRLRSRLSAECSGEPFSARVSFHIGNGDLDLDLDEEEERSDKVQIL
jgi:hypothetical protein